MSRFAAILQRFNASIDLPQPTKSRILLELAADMEDCYQAYTDRGLDEAGADARVREKFDLDDEALTALIDLHQPPMKKWMDRISSQAQTRLERIVLALMLVVVGLIAAQTMGNARFFQQASQFVLPMVGIALYATVCGLRKAFALYVRQDHDIRRLRSGLALPLILSGVNLLIGALGYFWELLKNGDWAVLLASEQIYLLSLQEPATRHTSYLLVEWMTRNAATMMVCLLISLYTALIWVGLSSHVARIEQAETDFVLQTQRSESC